MKGAILFCLLLNMLTTSAQTNFTGKWKLNPDKTEFNETPGSPAAAKLLVEQKNGMITLQRNDLPKETYKIDGEETEIAAPASDSSRTKVSMKFTADKKGLMETRIYSYPETETMDVAAKKTRTWNLSSDKKTLVIRDHIETKMGKVFDMLLIYDRQ